MSKILYEIYKCPESYKQFKKVIHATFPEVYDTKHMAYCSRRQLEDSNCINLTGNIFKHRDLVKMGAIRSPIDIEKD